MVLGHEGTPGVDKDSGLIHSVATTAAHVSDGVVAAELLHGEEKVLHGDAGYQGLEKREEMVEPEVDCPIAIGPGKRRHLPDDGEGAVQRWVERAKALAEPGWSTPDRCSSSSLGSGQSGHVAWPEIIAR